MSPGQSPLESSTTLCLPLLAQLGKEAKDFAYNHLNCCGPVDGTFTLTHTRCRNPRFKAPDGGHTQQLRQCKGERESGSSSNSRRWSEDTLNCRQWTLESLARLVSKSKSKAMGIFKCNWLIDFDSFACSLRCFTRFPGCGM